MISPEQWFKFPLQNGRAARPSSVDSMFVNSGEIPGDGIDNDNNGLVDDLYGYHDSATRSAGTYPTTLAHADVFCQEDSTIKGVNRQLDAYAQTMNWVATLDNSPADLNPQKGVVVIKDATMPEEVRLAWPSSDQSAEVSAALRKAEQPQGQDAILPAWQGFLTADFKSEVRNGGGFMDVYHTEHNFQFENTASGQMVVDNIVSTLPGRWDPISPSYETEEVRRPAMVWVADQGFLVSCGPATGA